MAQRQRTGPNKREQAGSGLPATDGATRSLWFSPPIGDQNCCRQLIRHRGAEPLAIITQDNVQAVTGDRRYQRPGPLLKPRPLPSRGVGALGAASR